MSLTANKPELYRIPEDEKLNFERRLTLVGKSIDAEWCVSESILRNVRAVEPLFSFYIYKVDKKIFKNTRGKSGKFTFIWKYVSKYKRANLVIFWLMKELRMNPGRTLYERLYATLNTIVFEPKKS